MKILSGVLAHPGTAGQCTNGVPYFTIESNMHQRSKWDYSEIKAQVSPGPCRLHLRTAKYGRATIAAADVLARDNPRHARGGRAPSRGKTPARGEGARRARCNAPHTRSIATNGTGTRLRAIRSLPRQGEAAFFEQYLDGIRKSGSSIGAVSTPFPGVPSGLGARIYAKLDTAELAAAMMEHQRLLIGVEIGVVWCRRIVRRGKRRVRNAAQPPPPPPPQARGVLRWHLHRPAGGGALCGEAATSSCSLRQTLYPSSADTNIMTKGRHDPCVGIRAVPVG